MVRYEIVIIGGGPAGLAAAVAARAAGAKKIVILERDERLGGILNQCIHNGFGLHTFKEELTGPEYAARFIEQVEALDIEYRLNTMVMDITKERVVTTMSSKRGICQIQADAIVLAMGCRERPRGALNIPGYRPAGIYTAGTAQRLVNMEGYLPGREVVILGSGDIGMIMARRLTLEGAHVKAVFEIQSYPSGLPRNIEQCLNDYNIPLYLSHTVTEIHGDRRLTGVTVSKVDEHMKPVPGTEEEYSCDTLILSVGLIPENELSLDAGVTLDTRTKGATVDEYFQTDRPGIFAAGNVLHVHDLVDFVSMEAEKLADSAARYIKDGKLPACEIQVKTDRNINHTVPQRISGTEDCCLSLRVNRPFKDCALVVSQNGREIARKKMKKALPAEMIHIDLKAEKLENKGDLEVKVE